MPRYRGLRLPTGITLVANVMCFLAREREARINEVLHYIDDTKTGSRAYAFVRHLVRDVARDAFDSPGAIARSSLDWNQGDPSVLVYSSDPTRASRNVSLSSMRLLFKGILAEAQTMMSRDILYLMGVPDRLGRDAWETYKDPLASREKTFFHAMQLADFNDTLLTHLFKSSCDDQFRRDNHARLNHLRYLFHKTGLESFEVDVKAVMNWLETLANFDRLLLVLLHLTSGMPPRASEWGGVDIADLRWFEHFKAFALLFHYNKTRGSVGDKLILRFIEPRVAELLLQRAVLVAPASVQLVIAAANWQKRDLAEVSLELVNRRTCIFVTPEGARPADRTVRSAFHSVTKAHHNPLTVSLFRQLIVVLLERVQFAQQGNVKGALRKLRISSDDSEEFYEDGPTEVQAQGGHSAGIAVSNYGRIGQADLEGINKDITTACYETSLQAQRLFCSDVAPSSASGAADDIRVVESGVALGKRRRADDAAVDDLRASPAEDRSQMPIVQNSTTINMFINLPDGRTRPVTSDVESGSREWLFPTTPTNFWSPEDAIIGRIKQMRPESDFPFTEDLCGFFSDAAGAAILQLAASAILGRNFEPRNIHQSQVMQLVAGNKCDVLYVAATGVGKTLPHQVFAYCIRQSRSRQAETILLIVPYLAIAHSFASWCREAEFGVEILDGDTNYSGVRGRCLSDPPAYLVAVVDQLQKPDALEALKACKIPLIVLDEVDNIFRDVSWRASMGAMLDIRGRANAHDARILATTATLTMEESHMLRLLLHLGVEANGLPARPFAVVRDNMMSRPEMRYEVVRVEAARTTGRVVEVDKATTEEAVIDATVERLASTLTTRDEARDLAWTTTIVFTTYITDAETIFDKLPGHLKPLVRVVHGGDDRLTAAERQTILTMFDNGEILALITTDVIKSGYHPRVPVAQVIIHGGRPNMATGEQRAGRGGRDGKRVTVVDIVDSLGATLPGGHGDSGATRQDKALQLPGGTAEQRGLALSKSDASSRSKELGSVKAFLFGPRGGCRRMEVTGQFSDCAVSCFAMPSYRQGIQIVPAELCDLCQARSQANLALSVTDRAAPFRSFGEQRQQASRDGSLQTFTGGAESSKAQKQVAIREALWDSLGRLRMLAKDRCVLCWVIQGTQFPEVPLHTDNARLSGLNETVRKNAVAASTLTCDAMGPRYCWRCSSTGHVSKFCKIPEPDAKLPDKFCMDCGLDMFHEGASFAGMRTCTTEFAGRVFVKVGFLILATVRSQSTTRADRDELLDCVQVSFGGLDEAKSRLCVGGFNGSSVTPTQFMKWMLEKGSGERDRLNGFTLMLAYLNSSYLKRGGRLIVPS